MDLLLEQVMKEDNGLCESEEFMQVFNKYWKEEGIFGKEMEGFKHQEISHIEQSEDNAGVNHS